MSESTNDVVLPGEPTEAPPAGLTIHQRMLQIVAELPAIGKDSRNTQQNFMYRSHDQVLNALNPLLAKWGVFMVPKVLSRETAQRRTANNKTLYEVNLHVQYTFYGLDGDSLTASAWGEGTDSGDKSTNKAMTMAFKNVIAQSFAISTADTVDSDSETDEETTGRFDGRAAGKHIAELEALISEIKELDRDPAHGGNYWFQVAINAAAKYHHKALEDLAEGEMSDILRRFREFKGTLEAPPETPPEAGALPVEETLERKDVAPFATPTSWAEVEQGVRAYGEETWFDFQVFLRQAKEHLFPDTQRMSQAKKDTLFQKAAGAVISLRETHDPSEFPPPVRVEFQAHWSKVLDGAVLPGPDWAMGPDEPGRPAREGSGETVAPTPEPEGASGTPTTAPPSPEQTFTDTPLSDNEQAVLDAVREEFPDATEVDGERAAAEAAEPLGQSPVSGEP